MNDSFLDIDYVRINKHTELAGGDVFLTKRDTGNGGIVSVLSDGLGSGVKANVLATLTATLAAGCIGGRISIERTAEVITNSLPTCSIRGLSYATFTIIDIDNSGFTRVIEYDNPPFLLLRNGEEVPVAKKEIAVDNEKGRKLLLVSSFNLLPEDRIAVFSDGVTQSGIGTSALPLGWQQQNAAAWITKSVRQNPKISSRRLAEQVTAKSTQNDIYEPKDDITCAVIYARKPRKLLIATGPPFDRDRDRELSRRIASYEGKKIINGGTTANIVSRELNREVTTDRQDNRDDLPPVSSMQGIDLVTEGIYTLSRALELLESGQLTSNGPPNGATAIIDHILESDIIDFLVGAGINIEHRTVYSDHRLESRERTVTRLEEFLKDRMFKEVRVEYI